MKINELDDSIKELKNTCFSGGADGADRLFTLYALENNIDVINFSFNRHKPHVPAETVLEIPQYILSDSIISKQLTVACSSLGRSVPKPGSYVYNLLARNRYQILNTDRIYCIAQVVSPTQVSGGTAWAVQMYMDSVENPEIYCYDMYEKQVYSYDPVLKEFVIVFEVPKPYGNWTGIGSRNASIKNMEHFRTYFKEEE